MALRHGTYGRQLSRRNDGFLITWDSRQSCCALYRGQAGSESGMPLNSHSISTQSHPNPPFDNKQSRPFIVRNRTVFLLLCCDSNRQNMNQTHTNSANPTPVLRCQIRSRLMQNDTTYPTWPPTPPDRRLRVSHRLTVLEIFRPVSSINHCSPWLCPVKMDDSIPSMNLDDLFQA